MNRSTQAVPEVAAARRRPWLPVRHLVGLALVGLFIVGTTAGSIWWLERRDAESTAMAAEMRVNIYDELAAAMVRNDREAFVSWGEGQGETQLARLWDETKRIGWSTGWIEGRAGDVVKAAPDAPVEITDDPSMRFVVSLGFDNERFEEYGGGLLWQSFEYDLDVTGEYGDARITALTPRAPMPWDDADGVAVARAENVVLFGYADEAALLDAHIADAQVAAESLLASRLGSRPEADIEGFVGFLTGDRDRWADGLFDPGDDPNPVLIDSRAAMKSYSNAPYVPEDAPDQPGLAQDGGSVAFFSDKAVGDGMLRTMAHEFAHSLHHAYAPDTAYSLLGADAEVGISAVSEGYAVLAADMIAGERDGLIESLQPEVLAAVRDGDIARITDQRAYSSPEESELAYRVAGAYFFYAVDQRADIAELLLEKSYTVTPFWMWIEKPRAGLTTSGWREWAAEQ